MSDWRISEKYRKPRRTKGTPFYRERNYYSLAVLAIGGICWYLYEFWPASKRLRNKELQNKFDYPEGLQTKIKHINMTLQGSPGIEGFLAKAREREIQKHIKEDEKSWFYKIMTKGPEL